MSNPFGPDPEFDDNRIKWNKRVVRLLYDLTIAYPSLRISQIIMDTNPFEEPERTYKRLCKEYETGGENDYED